MKKATFALSFVVAFFIPFSVGATTIYQQLSDSSGRLEIDTCANPDETVATFETVSTTTLNTDGFVFFVANSPSGGSVEFQIDDLHAFSSVSVPSGEADHFLESHYQTSEPEMGPGVHELKACYTVSQVYLRSNLSEQFLYGYITNDSVESVPIAPGISGFTDVGIATTSQQVWCASNFASTTGILDGIGHSISLGLCNVGVFLFVPSTASVNSFFVRLSEIQTKHPFAWAFDVRDTYSAYVATSSDALPSFSLDLGTSTAAILGSSEIELFGKDEVDMFLPASILTALKLLVSSLIWLTVIAFIYRQISGVWHRSVT
jgi:hypothetical protein